MSVVNTKSLKSVGSVAYLSRTRTAVLALCLVISASGCSTLQSPSSESAASLSDDDSSSYEIFKLSERAQLAYTESRLIEAVQLYQQVVEQLPTDADAWFRLGNTYTQQGAFERAIHAYETSLINDSQQPKAWFNLSTAYLLNAQSAMRQSFDRMRPNDPARALVDARLVALSALLHGRLEESSVPRVRTSR